MPDLDGLLAHDELDLVVLATPERAHAEQARARASTPACPCVVDKPLGVDAERRRGRRRTPRGSAGVPLTVFQNRRCDAEQLTLRAWSAAGQLGRGRSGPRCGGSGGGPCPRTAGARTRRPTEGGGILLDLHSHLVDAAVHLFGPVETVYAEVAARTTTSEDDAFLACRHAVRGGQPPRRHVAGRRRPGRAPGCSAGRARTSLNAFERDLDIYPDLRTDEDHCGWVYVGDERTPAPRSDVQPGRLLPPGRRRAAGGRRAGAMPVDPRDAVHTLAVIDAARTSSDTDSVVRVITPGDGPAPIEA